MSIQNINLYDKNCPYIVCDHCKLEVFKVTEGNAIWLSDNTGQEGLRFDVLHVHKECDQPFQNAHPAPEGSQWCWSPLERHFFHLLNNAEYDHKEAGDSDRRLGDAGF